MRISFDLDDTLICHGGTVPCEPRLPPVIRSFLRDEPLRKESRLLANELRRSGHELWIYTSSGRTAFWIRWWFRFHGIVIDGVVNGQRHAECFGAGSLPTKQPHAFGIHLHVDNAPGVAVEGKQHGFNVLVVEPDAEDWVERVLAAVAGS